MLVIEAKKNGTGNLVHKGVPNSSPTSRNGPNWKSVFKAILIIVAIAAAIYVTKAVIIPKIMEWAAPVAAAVTATAVKSHKTTNLLTKAVWLGQGQSVSIGNGPTTGSSLLNNVKTIMKPLEIIKTIFTAVSGMSTVETVSVPMGGGGGHAW